MPVVYLAWSIKYGEKVGDNPWMAAGLEWETSSPPPTENFTYQPIIDHDAYEFEHVKEIKEAAAKEAALQTT